MDEKALLDALRTVVREEVTAQLDRQKEAILNEAAQRTQAQLDHQTEVILNEATHRMQVLLDTEVTTKFNLLLERQDDFLRRMPNEDDLDIIDGRLQALEDDVALLKQAN